MKRYGFLIERIIEESNLQNAFDAVIQGKSKRLRIIRYLKRNKDRILNEIAEEIKSGTYKPIKYREFEICENGKVRTIQSLSYKDRIAIHAIMNILIEVLGGMLIRNTYAGIANRGIHDGMRRIRATLRDKEGTMYCLKIDIQKFYNSIDQDLMIAALEKKIKDKKLIHILTGIIRSYHKGLPIGYYSSQLFGNLYLCLLDYFVTLTLGISNYHRYCDDIVFFASTKEELHLILEKIKDVIENKLHLQIKCNYQIFPVDDRGVDCLGYVFKHTHTKLRKRIKTKALKKLHRVKSKKRRHEIQASLYGWGKHCNCINLFNKNGMKNFKELGVTYKPVDGKKRFEGDLISLSLLQNCEIKVLDFEKGINTKEGGGRYVVQYEYNGKKGKFITASEEMKNILDQVQEMGELPFTAIIRREIFGGNKTKYNFT